jgi:Zn-dependent protease with chaperone function
MVEAGGRSGRASFYPGQVYATSHLATYLGSPRVRLLLAVCHLQFWPFLPFSFLLLFSFLFIFFSYYYYYFEVALFQVLFSFLFFKFCEIEIWRIYPKTVAELLEILNKNNIHFPIKNFPSLWVEK